MNIQLFGAGFTNKGAELMLRTVIARLRERMPDARLAVTPDRQTPYEQRAELRLAHIYPNHQFFNPQLRKLLVRSKLATFLAEAPYRWLTPSHALSMYGLIDQDQVDALVDISGYSFGDGFHWIRTNLAAIQARRLNRRGKPVILMPQMFGPFEKPKVRSAFQKLCDAATLIYAREHASYDAVREVIGDDPRLHMAPDITIFSPHGPEVVTGHEAESYAVLVPNERMLDQGRGEWGDTYLPRLVAAGKQIASHGFRPAIVIHSGDEGDKKLAEELYAQLEPLVDQQKPFIFTHQNPLVLKQFIAGARYLVGSRFHSLVAALSSGVPGIALGWAHKYEMLASDFGIPELIHRGANNTDDLLVQVDALSNLEENQRLRNILVDRREAMRTQSELMWDNVFRVLESAARS
ncbi:polysaccharide pyruvyl transferase family protein [Aeoliella mucimassa]|uniref:Polysaccharide pyruvyl transferase n=1 Tax=Aeoliella mucimassa TaxID=2527972 RepID=A0A518AUS3_9BACT|nr:polysaccharide pyruvyl transferase family protein [Aeoliella mucimassa]QDU58479.1 Polysaccharide pyruvyl transferase [Aeoliella mucimassa]